MNRLISIFVALISVLPAFSGIENIMPKPKDISLSPGKGFKTGRPVKISDPTSSPELLRFADDASLRTTGKSKARVMVKIGEVKGAEDYELAGFPDEAYSIEISPQENFRSLRLKKIL